MKKIIAIVMVIVIISQVPVFGEESHELNIDSKIMRINGKQYRNGFV